MKPNSPLYWLSYRQDDTVAVVIQPAHHLVAARMKAALAGVEDSTFAEGHLLPEKLAKKVPADIGEDGEFGAQ
jgi:hypothetical protein